MACCSSMRRSKLSLSVAPVPALERMLSTSSQTLRPGTKSCNADLTERAWSWPLDHCANNVASMTREDSISPNANRLPCGEATFLKGLHPGAESERASEHARLCGVEGGRHLVRQEAVVLLWGEATGLHTVIKFRPAQYDGVT